MNDSAWSAWFEAIRHPEMDAALRDIYAQVDAAVALRQPRCDASGRCCRFNSYDHLLYVTGLEVAWFLAKSASLPVNPDFVAEAGAVRLPVFSPRAWPDSCRWQVDGLCSAHLIRPLGCRIYFCEKGTEDWQHTTYERFQDELKRLHEAEGIPYAYMEWRGAVEEGRRSLGV